MVRRKQEQESASVSCAVWGSSFGGLLFRTGRIRLNLDGAWDRLDGMLRVLNGPLWFSVWPCYVDMRGSTASAR